MLALSNPDPALNFPAGTVLQPQLFIRNTTARTLVGRLKFNWRKENANGKSDGPTLTLQPHETRRLDVSTLQDGATLPRDAQWASVTISTNAQPDEIMAVAASYDATLRYGAQTPFSDQLSHMWEGGQWEYDAMHDSIITAGNGGAKPVEAAFTIFYDQGQKKYDLEQTLQPDEQMWIDIGKLVRDRVPDKTGKLLPETLQSGSYQFRDLSHSSAGTLFEGKVIYDQTFGHVSYGCAACCAASLYTQLQYNPFGIGLDLQNSNEVQGFNSCTSAWTDINQDFPNWKTANPAIATTTSVGLHTGVSVGGTTSSTYGYVVKTNGRNGCYEVPNVSQSGPTNVTPCATSVSLSNTTPIPLANDFPTYKTGIGIVAAMQAQPSTSNWDGTTLVESVSPASSTCPASFGQCSSNLTFTVGAGGDSVGGVSFVPQHNIFYDQHTTVSAASILDVAGISECTIKCSQTYSCGGKVLGTFSITKAFSKGTISGTPVTFVTVTKQ